MGKIKVVSNASKREVFVDEPEVLGMETLEDLVKAQGEDVCINQIKGALKIGFRAVIRRKLDEVDDNGEPTLSDEDIAGEDYSEWVPKLRVTKTAEEKALELLGNLDPSIRESVLANFKA